MFRILIALVLLVSLPVTSFAAASWEDVVSGSWQSGSSVKKTQSTRSARTVRYVCRDGAPVEVTAKFVGSKLTTLTNGRFKSGLCPRVFENATPRGVTGSYPSVANGYTSPAPGSANYWNGYYFYNGRWNTTPQYSGQYTNPPSTQPAQYYFVNGVRYVRDGSSYYNSYFISSASARIESLASSSLNVSPGAYDVELARVRVRATDGDIVLRDIVFTQRWNAQLSTTLDSSYIETINGQRLANGFTVADRVEFRLPSSSSYRVNNGGYVDLIVKARLSSAVSNFSTLRLDLGNYADSVRGISQGIGATRVSDGSRITFIWSVIGPVITLTNAVSGNVRATVGISSSSPRNLTIGSQSNEIEVARFDITATNDAIRLADLYLENLGTLDLSSRVRSLSFYDNNGVFIARWFVEGSKVIHLSLGNASNFVVARNTTRALSLRAAFDLNSSIYNGENGGTLRLRISAGAITPVSDTVNGVRLYAENNGLLVRDPIVTFDSTSEHRIVSTSSSSVGFTSSSFTTESFTIGVPSTGRLFVRKIRSSIQIPNGGPTGYALYRDRESASNLLVQGSLASGTNSLVMDLTNVSANGLEISGGSNKTFVLVFFGGNPSSGSRVTRILSLEYASEFGSIIDTTGYSNVGLPIESVYRY